MTTTAVGTQSNHASEFVVRAAVLAPSLHNSQPWRFVSRNGEVELRADATRRLPIADPDGREMVISCGAALLNLCLAMRHLGFRPLVRVFPDPHDTDLLVVVRWGPYVQPTRDEEDMYRAIPLRHTHRGPFHPEPLPLPLARALRTQSALEHVGLRFIAGTEDLRRLTTLIRQAETAQRHQGAFAAELANWTPLKHGRRLDGVPSDAYPRDPDGLAFPGRNYGRKRRGYATDPGPFPPEALGTIAVLTTAQDTRLDWLQAGQALQRVLLYAMARHVAAALHTQPLEVADLRDRVRRTVTPGGYPQMILRLGYTEPRTQSRPRRPVSAVLTRRPHRTGPRFRTTRRP